MFPGRCYGTGVPQMRVKVRIRESTVTVDVGPGHQRLKWLAMVALQRYADASVPTDPSAAVMSHAEVAVGLMDAEGNELPPNKSVRVALKDGEEVFALLQRDEEITTSIPTAKGTSKFLMMQGAAPSKCIISGPGITYALAGQPAMFSLQARDTYGNLTSNGGERFEVKVSVPDSLTAKQLAELERDPPPTVVDRGDGSYLVSHTMTKKGRYDVSVELDGEPIAGSPFSTVATKTCAQHRAAAACVGLPPRRQPPDCSGAHCTRGGTRPPTCPDRSRAADDQVRPASGEWRRARPLFARGDLHLRPDDRGLWRLHQQDQRRPAIQQHPPDLAHREDEVGDAEGHRQAAVAPRRLHLVPLRKHSPRLRCAVRPAPPTPIPTDSDEP